MFTLVREVRVPKTELRRISVIDLANPVRPV